MPVSRLHVLARQPRHLQLFSYRQAHGGLSLRAPMRLPVGSLHNTEEAARHVSASADGTSYQSTNGSSGSRSSSGTMEIAAIAAAAAAAERRMAPVKCIDRKRGEVTTCLTTHSNKTAGRVAAASTLASNNCWCEALAVIFSSSLLSSSSPSSHPIVSSASSNSSNNKRNTMHLSSHYQEWQGTLEEVLAALLQSGKGDCALALWRELVERPPLSLFQSDALQAADPLGMPLSPSIMLQFAFFALIVKEDRVLALDLALLLEAEQQHLLASALTGRGLVAEREGCEKPSGCEGATGSQWRLLTAWLKQACRCDGEAAATASINRTELLPLCLKACGVDEIAIELACKVASETADSFPLSISKEKREASINTPREDRDTQEHLATYNIFVYVVWPLIGLPDAHQFASIQASSHLLKHQEQQKKLQRTSLKIAGAAAAAASSLDVINAYTDVGAWESALRVIQVTIHNPLHAARKALTACERAQALSEGKPMNHKRNYFNNSRHDGLESEKVAKERALGVRGSWQGALAVLLCSCDGSGCATPRIGRHLGPREVGRAVTLLASAHRWREATQLFVHLIGPTCRAQREMREIERSTAVVNSDSSGGDGDNNSSKLPLVRVDGYLFSQVAYAITSSLIHSEEKCSPNFCLHSSHRTPHSTEATRDFTSDISSGSSSTRKNRADTVLELYALWRCAAGDAAGATPDMMHHLLQAAVRGSSEAAEGGGKLASAAAGMRTIEGSAENCQKGQCTEQKSTMVMMPVPGSQVLLDFIKSERVLERLLVDRWVGSWQSALRLAAAAAATADSPRLLMTVARHSPAHGAIYDAAMRLSQQHQWELGAAQRSAIARHLDVHAALSTTEESGEDVEDGKESREEQGAGETHHRHPHLVSGCHTHSKLYGGGGGGGHRAVGSRSTDCATATPTAGSSPPSSLARARRRMDLAAQLLDELLGSSAPPQNPRGAQ